MKANESTSLGATSNFNIKSKVNDSTSLANVTNTNKNTGSGAAYLGKNIGLGVLGIAEGAMDLVEGGLSQLFGGENGDKYAKYLHGNDVTGELTQKLNESYNPNGAMKFLGEAAQGIGQSSIFYLNSGIKGLGTALFFAGAAGRSVTEAYQKTGEINLKTYAYAAAEGGVEAALELITNGGAPGLEQGKTTLVGGLQKLMGKTAKETATSAVRNGIIKNVISEASGEFLEEFIEAYTGVFNQRLFQIDPNASTTFGEAVYAGLVGAASGGIMAGVSNTVHAGYSNYRGNKIISEGKAGNLVKTVETMQQYVKSNDWSKYYNKDTIEGTLNDLIAAYQAYNKLSESDRTGARAAVYLGEMQVNLAQLEIAMGNGSHEQYIKEHAEDYVEAASRYAGEEMTADDIRANKNNVTTDLAIQRWIGLFNDSKTIGQSKEDWIRATVRKYAGTSAESIDNADIDNTLTGVTKTGRTAQGIEYSENDDNGIISRVYDLGNGRSAIAVQQPDMETWKIDAGESATMDIGDIETLRSDVSTDKLDATINEIRNNYDSIVNGIRARREQAQTAAEERKAEPDTESKAKKAEQSEKLAQTAEKTEKQTEKPSERAYKTGNVIKGASNVKYITEDDLKTIDFGKGDKRVKSELTLKQSATVQLLSKWFDKSNMKIVLFEGNGSGRNGAYAGNTVYIDIKSSMLQVAAHELVHSFSQRTPELYTSIEGFVRENLFKGDAIQMDEAIKKYQDKYSTELKHKVSYESAKEELIAKSCEKVFDSVKGIQQMLAYDKTLFAKANDYFGSMLTFFEQIAEDGEFSNEYAEAIADNVDAISGLRDRFAEAMKESLRGESDSTKAGSDRFSVNDKIKKYKTLIDSNTGKYIGRNIDGNYFGLTDNVNKAITSRADIEKAYKSVKFFRKNGITLAESFIEKSVQQKVYDVDAVREAEKAKADKAEKTVKDSYFYKAIGNDSYIRAGNVTVNSESAINLFVKVAESLGAKIVHKSESSVYLNMGDTELRVSDHELPYNAQRESKVTRWDGEVVLDDIGMEEFLSAQTEEEFKTYVEDKFLNPDKDERIADYSAKYSISEDSDGKSLSEQQKEYFKQSKIVDEDGRLLKVYHGTDAEFTVFDKTKGRSSMDIQGSFFSPWAEDAGGYGSKVKAYYLNIKNPASESVAYKALNQFKGQNDAGVKAREYLQSIGYDGVNNGGEEFIAFNAEQIKLADNTNPTYNEDIRFSLSDDNKYNYSAEQQDEAREYVKNFDAYGAEQRRSVMEFLKTAKGTRADKDTLKSICNIITAADDLDVRFADTGEKGQYLTSESGYRLILLDNNLESAEAIRQTLAAEVIHMSETSETYGAFARMVLNATTKEEQQAVMDKYTAYYKSIGQEVDKETLLKECVSELGSGLMADYDIVKQWTKADKNLAYRLITGARDLARKLFGKDKEAYRQAATLTKTLAAATAESQLRRAVGAPEIKWSLADKVRTRDNEIKRLKTEVELLNELVKLQGVKTDGTKFTPESLRSVASMIMRRSDATGDKNRLVKLLMPVYDYMRSIDANTQLDAEKALSLAQPAIDYVYSNQRVGKVENCEAREILNYLKGKKVYVSDEERREIENRYGKFGDWRNAVMGIIETRTSSGEGVTSMDSLWADISAMYPGIFDVDTVSGDQAPALADAIEKLKAAAEAEDLQNATPYEDAQYEIFGRVLDGYWKLAKLETVADKYSAKIDELNSKHNAEMKALKDEMAAKLREASAEKRKAVREAQQQAREIHYFTRAKAKQRINEFVDRYLGRYFGEGSELDTTSRDFSGENVSISDKASLTISKLDKMAETYYQALYTIDGPVKLKRAAAELAKEIMANVSVKGTKSEIKSADGKTTEQRNLSVTEVLNSRNSSLAYNAEKDIASAILNSLNGGEIQGEEEKIKVRYDNLLKKVKDEYQRREDRTKAEIDAAQGTQKATLQAIEQISRTRKQYKDGQYKYIGALATDQMKVLSDAIIKAKTTGGFLSHEGVRNALIAYEKMFSDENNRSALNEEYELLGLDVNSISELNIAVREQIAGLNPESEIQMKAKLTEAELDTFLDVARAVAQLYRTYNKYYDEKRKQWIDADETATKAINNIKEIQKLGETDKKLIKTFKDLMTHYGIEGLDPLAMARLLDGYADDGVMTEIMTDIINAENNKQYRIMQYMKSVDTFIKEHKGFEDHLTNEQDMVEYKGTKLTRDEFIQLYMTTFRKQALLHLGLGRMEFGSVNGKYGLRIIEPAITNVGKNSDAGNMEKVEMPTLENLQSDSEKVVMQIRELGDKVLTAEDKAYIALMENFYNVTSTQDKSEIDLKYFGMTNVSTDEGDKYVPIVTSNSSRASSVTDERSAMLGFTTLSGQSFNKNTIQGAKNPLLFNGSYSLMQRHANGLAAYAELYGPMQKLDRIWSTDINHNKQNSNRLRDAVSSAYGDNAEKYIRNLMGDIQGINTKKPNAFNAIINKIRSNYAIYQLGANPKTWFNQLGSMGALVRFCDVDSIMKGLNAPNKEQMVNYSTAAAIRAGGDVAVKAQTLTQQRKGKLTEIAMKPIGYSDMKIVQMSWGACQYEVQKKYGYAVGTTENMKRAGELLNRVINESQDTSMASTKTGIARSDSELIKGFAMFRSAPFKQFSRLLDAAGTLTMLNTKKKAGYEISEERMMQAKTELCRTAAGWTAQALIGIAITSLFTWLYAKDKDDEDETVWTKILDFTGELISVIPIVGDIYSYFVDGFDMSYFLFDMANEAGAATKSTVKMVGNAISGKRITRQDITSQLVDDINVAGQFTGIPTRNIKNFLVGITKRISSIFGGELAYDIDSALYTQSYQADLKKAIEKGNTKLAEEIVSLLYADMKATSEVSSRVASEVVKLYDEGYTSVLPPSVGDTITVDDVDYDINAKEQKQIRNIANRADAVIVNMLSGSQYAALSSAEKAQAISSVYKLYYDKAVNEVFGVPMSKTDALSRLGDAQTILTAAAHIKAIESDKDESGKVVSGSRKAKVSEYLNSLNVNSDMAFLILYASGYNSESLQTAVRQVAATSNLTSDDYAEIISALGLTE